MEFITQSKIIKRAGRLSGLLIWVESTCDFYISMKEDPNLLKDYRKNNDITKILYTLWKNNKKRSMKKIVQDFKENFSRDFPEAYELIEEFWIVRDVLSHFHPTGDKTVFLNLNERSRKDDVKMAIIEKLMEKKLGSNEAVQIPLDKKSYRSYLRKIKKFDDIYFPEIAKQFGCKYIRWPNI